MKSHHHTVSLLHTNQKQVPQIRLSGQWLARNGFQPGCKFIVYELSGYLVLSLPWPEKEKKEEVIKSNRKQAKHENHFGRTL